LLRLGSRDDKAPRRLRRFLAAGGFVKHILLAVPLAVGLDLLWKDRRQFLRWCFCGIAAVTLFAVLSYVTTGGHEWPEIFTPREHSWHDTLYSGRKLLITFKIPIAVSIFYLAQRLPPSQTPLLRCFGIIALSEGIILSGGDGVSFNVYLEFTVFLGLIAGLALGRWRERRRDERYGALIGVTLAMIAALPLVTRAPGYISGTLNLDTTLYLFRYEEISYGQAKSILGQEVRPVFCDDLLLCLEAGKPSVIDRFSVHSQIRVGRRIEATLIDEIANQRFGMIELPTEIHPDPNHPARFAPYLLNQGRFTERTLTAIDRYYRPSFISGAAVLFVPRQAVDSPFQ
jgi:hypothetical protein